MAYSRSNNGNANRLLKQIEESETDWKEGRIPKIRIGSYKELMIHFKFYDTPPRSGDNRNWKRHRKTQYKRP